MWWQWARSWFILGSLIYTISQAIPGDHFEYISFWCKDCSGEKNVSGVGGTVVNRDWWTAISTITQPCSPHTCQSLAARPQAWLGAGLESCCGSRWLVAAKSGTKRDSRSVFCWVGSNLQYHLPALLKGAPWQCEPGGGGAGVASGGGPWPFPFFQSLCGKGERPALRKRWWTAWDLLRWSYVLLSFERQPGDHFATWWWSWLPASVSS